MNKEEQIFLINQAGCEYYYSDEQLFDDKNKKIVIDMMKPYLKDRKNILELGYTNKIWTNELLRHSEKVTIIEAAKNHIDKCNKDFEKNTKVTIVHGLFEDFPDPEEKFDLILMSGVIKHVPNDLDFIKQTKKWLNKSGLVIATTPNSRSFHRRLGAYMGYQELPNSHNNRDISVFNVHLYDRFQWRNLFAKAGYRVHKCEGVFLKPFSTEQMMHLSLKFDVDKINAGLTLLGEELQDYCWYLFLVADIKDY